MPVHSRTEREARAGTTKTETSSPIPQPRPTSMIRSAANPSGPRVELTMMAVIGATREPAEKAARNERGATATTRAAAWSDRVCVWDREGDGAAVDGAEQRDPTNRS